MIIDTHSHLDGEEFGEDLQDVIARAKDAGIGKILIPNINADTLPNILTLCKTHPDYLFPMIGLHPEDVKEDYKLVLDAMEKQLNITKDYIAVGEIGIDLYWNDTYKEQQLEAFDIQVKWAEKYGLPLMIHTRNAHREVVEILSSNHHNNIKGIFHCFTGSSEEAEELLSFDNFMIGIGGVLTFKKSTLRDVVKSTIPLERIVLETDSPYMAPVPYRGKRNESAFVVEVTRKLSEIFNCSYDEVCRQTTSNALAIFDKIR